MENSTKRNHRHHHHHRHHHRHGKLYRIRRWFRQNKLLTLFTLALVFVVLSGVGLLIHTSIMNQSKYHVTVTSSTDVDTGYRNITYNGQEYQYNNLITTILLIGVDSEGTLEKTAYTSAPQAYSINLMILDKKNSKMTIMALNCDTMTEVRRYTREGTLQDTYTEQLGYAYTYGDGIEVSCENMVYSVETLLGDIPVDEYIATNVSTLSFINSLVNGVTVEVPNDDLAEDYEEFQEGSVVTLDDSNIEAFLCTRDTDEEFGNLGRMERERTFMLSFVDQFMDCVSDDLYGTWAEIEKVDEYVLTSITKNKYLTLADLFLSIDFDECEYYTPEDEDYLGSPDDEFYVDEEALQEKIIELFYLPA
ncbi:MAG: LCP family protein [Lachnospiraceae bacterium]|nr:LCP family protein [Lachnospiraceae bacterium]